MKECKYFNAILNYLGDDVEFKNKLVRSLTSSSLTIEETNMFFTMFDAFRMMYNISCSYFRVAEYTDGVYTLNVRKDLGSSITIKFKVNPNYSGNILFDN